MQDLWSSGTTVGARPSKSAPCSPIKPIVRTRSDCFHIAHKVPVGDTPYVRAKRVQLVDRDPEKAIALFWAAINAGDRVDSALKDMAVVMKQQNRGEEAIEAIKSLRCRCSDQSQESLDNILLDLYKRCGRLDDQIALLRHKLRLIQQGMAFNGKPTKTARSQGRKFQVSLEQEATRLLGNLGWALMQQDNYAEAEAAYRRALLLGSDNNKMCNMGICLMKQGRVAEAKAMLRRVRPAAADGPGGADSHLKAFERAQEMLRDLESRMTRTAADRLPQRWALGDLLPGSSSSVWRPQPCLDFASSAGLFGDENVDVNRVAATRTLTKPEQQLPSGTSLNVAAPPFYSKLVKKPEEEEEEVVVLNLSQLQDPLGKRTRSGAAAMENPTRAEKNPPGGTWKGGKVVEESSNRSCCSLWVDDAGEDEWLELLPDNEAFEEAIVAAVLAPPVLEAAEAMAGVGDGSPALERNVGKRLRVLEDVTLCMSPRWLANFN